MQKCFCRMWCFTWMKQPVGTASALPTGLRCACSAAQSCAPSQPPAAPPEWTPRLGTVGRTPKCAVGGYSLLLSLYDLCKNCIGLAWYNAKVRWVPSMAAWAVCNNLHCTGALAACLLATVPHRA